MDARLRAAETIAARYAEDPTVTTVLCGGSTGRGHADRWSDLELAVFRSRPPDEESRRQVIEKLGGSDPRLFGYDSEQRHWFDEWWWEGTAGDGLLIEAVHMTEADAGALLDDLLDAADVRPSLLAFASALAHGRPVAGSSMGSADSLERLTARVLDYPRSVAAAVIGRHGQIDHFWRWQMYHGRSDIHGLRGHFAAVVSAMTHVLCALNRRWWPGVKWQPWVLSGLPIAPERLVARLAETERFPPGAAAACLAQLVEETYDLVAEHLPEVDTARLRAIFRFTRSPWPPSYGVR